MLRVFDRGKPQHRKENERLKDGTADRKKGKILIPKERVHSRRHSCEKAQVCGIGREWTTHGRLRNVGANIRDSSCATWSDRAGD